MTSRPYLAERATPSSPRSASPSPISYVLDYTGQLPPSVEDYHNSQEEEDLPTPTEYIPVKQSHATVPNQTFFTRHLQANFKEIMDSVGGVLDIYIFEIGLNDFINSFDEFFCQLINKKYISNDDKFECYAKFKKIEDKFEKAGSDILNRETTNNMSTWMQFVYRQPDVFQLHYLDCFMRDTEKDGNIRSTKDIYERVLYTIADACVLYCTQYKKKLTQYKTKRNKSQKKKTKKDHNLTRGGTSNSMYHNCDNAVYSKLIRLIKK